MNVCKVCGGNTKQIKDDYVIKTRIPGYKEIVLADVWFDKCKICGYSNLPIERQSMADNLKRYYTNKYIESNLKPDYAAPEKPNTSVKEFFKKICS